MRPRGGRQQLDLRSRYILVRLIRQRDREAKVIDWLDELTAECPKKIARNMNDPCGAKCPQLPKVL
jgi:hypothetical protein